MTNVYGLQRLATLVRSLILRATTAAGSGHPTSSLSAVELLVALLFGGVFRFAVHEPGFANNDHLIFSKGHAAPLFYALWAVAGAMPLDELLTLRKFGSRLEGHPTLAFPFTEVATGSLGQGLSVGVGMALNAKYVDHLPYRTYVLLGDSEMAEGSVWEAIQIAAQYKLDNLVGILDVNRLGQRGETMYGHDCAAYAKRVAAFGWETIIIDGHDRGAIRNAYERAQTITDRPVMIIAKTIKGKGVSFIENRDGWHGKPLSADELKRALEELGEVNIAVRGEVAQPVRHPERSEGSPTNVEQRAFARDSSASPQNDIILAAIYPPDKPVATRKAYGNALVRLASQFPNIVVLDAEVSNSTFAEIFKKKYLDRFFEMYIAEQNMVGAALGFSRRGKIPFCSTFAAFFSRAFDQIRMSQYADANIKFVGSHAGVSIGEDGASQMGLEDIAIFRTLHDGVVLYPADAIATERLVEAVAQHHGNVYIRTTRGDTPILYSSEETFPIGGSKVLHESGNDVATIIAAGITLHEALAAYEILRSDNIFVRVIDCYSIKPIDHVTLEKAARETKAIITVEDHYPEGGLGEAVSSALGGVAPVYILAVRKMPKSGTQNELLDYEEIGRNAIIKRVKVVIR